MGGFSPQEVLRLAKALGVRNLLARQSYAVWQWLQSARHDPDTGEHLSVRGVISALLRRQPDPADYEALRDVLSLRVDRQAIDLCCRNGTLRLEVLASDLIRLRLKSSGSDEFPPLFSYALDPETDWPQVDFEVVDDDAQVITVRTAHLSFRVDRSTCALAFLDGNEQPLCETETTGFWGRGVFWRQYLQADEAIYGLGERAFDLNLRGRSLELWNRDPQCYLPGDDPIHLCIPMYVGLREGRAYAFFLDGPGRARFDVGVRQANRLHYEAGGGELCAYFFAGPTIESVLKRYTQLTGRMPLPPRWMLGYHQSRWSYYPAGEVRSLVAEFRRRDIPCDAIHLDIHHMEGYRIFTWDPARFPDPPGLLAELREQGFRVITIVDPGVKVDDGYAIYKEGCDQDAFCVLAGGRPFKGPVWPGWCAFPDYTDPEVRLWWGGLYRSMLDAGVAGVWNDMNEPAIFGGLVPDRLCHDYDGRGATHAQIHNVYGMQMVRASAEGVQRIRPNERVPVITRSGYAGVQRFAMVWTGDNQSTWEQLRLSISMCLNLGLSGMAFCGPDVGGFAGDCDGELLVRWTQLGALMPFFRNHSALGTVRQEPWAFGEPFESICRQWIQLRYRLLPYLYTTAWQASQSGMPMMRPMAMESPGDPRMPSLCDQFLMGDTLLVAPMGQAGQTSRKVHLPDGIWYDFWSDDCMQGEVKADAALDRMPIYARAGTVLPLGPVIQHTDQWPPETLELHVYPGNGESWLYEDDGHSTAYKSGEFSRTRFVSEIDDRHLLISREVEGRYEPGYQRYEICIHGLAGDPHIAIVDGQPAAVDFEPDRGLGRMTVGAWSQIKVSMRSGSRKGKSDV